MCHVSSQANRQMFTHQTRSERHRRYVCLPCLRGREYTELAFSAWPTYTSNVFKISNRSYCASQVFKRKKCVHIRMLFSTAKLRCNDKLGAWYDFIRRWKSICQVSTLCTLINRPLKSVCFWSIKELQSELWHSTGRNSKKLNSSYREQRLAPIIKRRAGADVQMVRFNKTFNISGSLGALWYSAWSFLWIRTK